MKKRMAYVWACILVLTVLFTSCYKIDGDGMVNTQNEDSSTEQREATDSLEESTEEFEQNQEQFQPVEEYINVTEENKEQNYQVINCNEWVSLREGPGSSYKRLKKVPLGAIVTDYNKVVDGFRYVWFEDMSGYIGEDYLQVYTKEYHEGDHYVDGTHVYPAFHYEKKMNYDEIQSFGNDPQKFTYGEYSLLYSRGYTDAGEIMKVGCFRNGKPLWGYVTGNPYCAELDATAVILTESIQNMRHVVLFNSEIGLKAINFFDGSIAWEINVEDLGVGGSPCYAVDEEGTLYISGYYDSAPVAVTFDGKVLWKASMSDSDVYWPYRIEVKEKNILVTYASEHEKGTYVVTFDKKSGKEQKIEIIPF